MKSAVVHFMPKPFGDTEVQLFDFVRHSRERLTVFGKEIDWEAVEWPGAGRFSKLALRKSRALNTQDRLDPRFIDFAKAYFRYQQGIKPTKTKNELKALKLIEAVVSDRLGPSVVSTIDMTALDKAAQLAREHYSAMAAYHAGRELERLAIFVTEKKLVQSSISGWKSPIQKPSDDSIQVGPAARKRHQERLPAEKCLEALAEIFSQSPTHPRDVFTSSTWPMLLGAPSRGTEVLLLPVDLEVVESNRLQVPRYGWRFYSGKGFEGDVKWIPEVMESVAREAVRRIRELTEPGRQLARWIETNPTEFYRHLDCPRVESSAPLSAADAARALGVPRLSRAGLSEEDGAHTLSSLWRWCLERLPKGFPWACEERRLKYSDALFCMRLNELRGSGGASPVRLWMPDINCLNNDLSRRATLAHHRTIFDRYHYTNDDGSALGLTTHSARHLLNTIADRGGLSSELIAKWSGRADPRQNRVYNHVDEFQMVSRIEAVNPGLTCFGPGGELVKNEPISTSQVSQAERGAFHWTEFGVCVHDYTMSPCDRFRDCIGCTEHVCIKGDQEREKRIRVALKEVEVDLSSASSAFEQGLAGADRWFDAHARRISQFKELLELLEDPLVPNGAQLRLGKAGSFSHLGRIVDNENADRRGLLGAKNKLGEASRAARIISEKCNSNLQKKSSTKKKGMARKSPIEGRRTTDG
jgi:hypothetical protein